MDLKNFLLPQGKRMEYLLRKYAIYTPDKSKVILAPTQRLFPKEELEYFSEGIQARIFKSRKLDLVVKEGRWDLDLKLFPGSKLSLPANITEKALKLFSYSFLPDLKEVLRQFKGYLRFVQYFGYFKDEKDFYHPNLELIMNAQQNIRESLSFFVEDLERYHRIKFAPGLEEILNSDMKYLNFLPKEYLLYGKSISPENNGRDTYYIIQEFVKGDLLHDVDDRLLPPDIKKQMILMVYLMLLMDYQIHLVPDTRPRYPLLQAYNFLTKTDNIIVTKNNGIKFIDTRWFWDRKSNFIKRGLLIPDMIIGLAKKYINILLEDVNN
jgi:hypothetical protein